MTPNQPSLQQIYARELKPVLEALEVERLRLRNRVLGSVAIALPFVIFAGYFLGLLGWLLGAVGALVFVDRFSKAPWEHYRRQFKHRVVQRLVKHYNPSFSYSAENGISRTVFDSSQMFRRKSDRYHCEDLVSGKIGKTRFRFSEIRAEYKTRSNNGDAYNLLFGGIFFVADFNKFFQGTTLIVPNFTGRMGQAGQVLEGMGTLGRIQIALPLPNPDSSKKSASTQEYPSEPVKLEDPTFEKLFAVYSTDQVEARYILSTSLMQRLVEHCQVVWDSETGAPRSSILAIAFANSSVHIAVSTFKNYFEPPSIFQNSTVMTLKDMETYLLDLKLAEDIVETLNLNVRIWGKR